MQGLRPVRSAGDSLSPPGAGAVCAPLAARPEAGGQPCLGRVLRTALAGCGVHGFQGPFLQSSGPEHHLSVLSLSSFSLSEAGQFA